MPYVIRTKISRVYLDEAIDLPDDERSWVDMLPHVTVEMWNDIIAEYSGGELRNEVPDLTFHVMKKLIVDWNGFVDEEGNALDYTSEHLAALNAQSALYKRLVSETNERMGDTDPKGGKITGLPSQEKQSQ